MLVGETHGRRDYVFIYSGEKAGAVVKERFKIKVPGPGENPIAAKFYDLYRDTREEWPVATEVGAWGGAEFVTHYPAPHDEKAEVSRRSRPALWPSPTTGWRTFAPKARPPWRRFSLSRVLR